MPPVNSEIIKIAIHRNAESVNGKMWHFSIVLPNVINLNDYILIDNNNKEWDFIVDIENPSSTTNGPFIPSGPSGYLCSCLRIYANIVLLDGCTATSAYFYKKEKIVPIYDIELPITLNEGKLTLCNNNYKVKTL